MNSPACGQTDLAVEVGVATKSAISQNGGHWVATRFWVVGSDDLRHGSDLDIR